MGTHVTGINRPYDIVFGPDSAMYVNLYTDNEVVRIDPSTLAQTIFVSAGAGGLDTPEQMAFGPDGHLYVSSFGSDQVLKFNGTTGASMSAFVASGVGGLDEPTGLAFGPDGHLYVGEASVAEPTAPLAVGEVSNDIIDALGGGGFSDPRQPVKSRRGGCCSPS